MSSTRPPASRSTTRKPSTWAIVVGCAVLAYPLLQPWLSQQLGWQLPSLAGNQSTPVQVTDPPTRDPVEAEAAVPSTVREDSQENRAAADDQQLLFGVLREIAPEDYLSPAGLRYTRGSEQGHRLKHLERHLEDDPGRPGKHGVFDGDMPQVLRWLDQAYEAAKQRAPGTNSRQESGGRTVYEAEFPRPIGFVGGRDGKRDNHPDANRIRLVVEGNRLITAFPF